MCILPSLTCSAGPAASPLRSLLLRLPSRELAHAAALSTARLRQTDKLAQVYIQGLGCANPKFCSLMAQHCPEHNIVS